MPDYGVRPPEAGTGLLPWAWAVEQLAAAHDYWVCTSWPDGRPHLTPVWGAWLDGSLWFSCGPRSRKTRNLERDPRCSVATSDPRRPVVVSGTAERLTEPNDIARYTAASNEKYPGYDYTVEFFAANALWRVAPDSAIGMIEDDFTGSPTRWEF
ncbi:MAG: pyridoxamine 5'-phosphate oxidase family protein [Candidatus Rokubacteria bacterium]|nr:pyridoxamine 5'-phosphate oxidase family protein [Candidatus Rokubacteria bacterium]